MKYVKRFFLLILLLKPLSVQSIEKLKPHPLRKEKPTLYSFYLIFKLLISIYISFPFWMDFEKVKQCNMYCDQCDFKVNIMESYGYFAASGRADILDNFKKLLRKSSVQSICQYLVKINMQEERECVMCHDYCGWHAKNSEIEVVK